MPVTQERFEQGLTYEAYKAQMTRNQDRFLANEETVDLNAEDVAFFAALPLNVLVIAEDWCGDVINNLPVLGRLAAASGNLNVRVFLRDENLDLIDQYLKDGQFRSIPVFVFFDRAFNQLGYWIERPAAVRAATERFRADLFKNDPLLSDFSPDTAVAQMPDDARLRLTQAMNTFREEQRVFSDHEVVRELRTIVEGGLQTVAPSTQRAAAGAAPTAEQPVQRTPHPIKVSITYCAECGYEPQTLGLTSALMQEFVTDLGSIELIPWHDGAFDVVVDGDLVHSMYRDGGFPKNDAIIAAVRERLTK